MKKKSTGALAVLLLVGVVMVYPLLWLFLATFKDNAEIFGKLSFWPEKFSFDAYVKGWKSIGQFTYTDFYLNTFKLVVPSVLLTVASTGIVAYGFARFKFPGKKPLFALMLSTLMLPDAIVIIPRYVAFNKFGWVDTYMPFWMPALLACYPFLIFMLIQFLRGIPRELEEAAEIDGCNVVERLWYVIVPMLKPSIVSCALFQFMWASNDFMGPLIYINSVRKYPVSIFLRMSMDTETGFDWNRILAMSLLAIIPSLAVFFMAQDSFVDGIAAGGVKG